MNAGGLKDFTAIAFVKNSQTQTANRGINSILKIGVNKCPDIQM